MIERRVTLANVAAKAGVHVTTVSMALRNNPRLPESTRNRLQALAREMGYRPDPLLRALVSYRGEVRDRHNIPTLAYVTNWPSRWGWKKASGHLGFFTGAETMARQLGYKLEHFWVGEPDQTHGGLSRMLSSRGINGLIVASHSRDRGDELQFDWPRFTAVKIDYFPHAPALNNVANHQCDVVQLAMQKAVAFGYRRIGFAMHRGWDHALNHMFTAGFLSEQQHLAAAHRLPAHIFPEAHPVERWYNEKTAPLTAELAGFSKWFNQHRPEVLISKASFVLPLLTQMGVRIPRDLAFIDVSLDKIDGVTAGVRQNHETVGATAVGILDGQLQRNQFGVPEIPTTTFVEGTWFDGRSCPSRRTAGETAA